MTMTDPATTARHVEPVPGRAAAPPPWRLPERDIALLQHDVSAVITQLFDLLLSGRHRNGDIAPTEQVEQRLPRLIEETSHLAPARRGGWIDPWTRRRAEAASGGLIEALPAIRAALASDALAAYQGDPAAVEPVEIVLTYPGFLATAVYRLAHRLWRLDVPLLPRLMTEWAHRATGIDIHPGAQIGQGFFIDHGTGVVIGETTTIGSGVRLYQGVTLGALSLDRDRDVPQAARKRHPTVEDGVTIYANAMVLGGDTVIGRDSVVGAGTLVTRSIPARSVVKAAIGTLQRQGG